MEPQQIIDGDSSRRVQLRRRRIISSPVTADATKRALEQAPTRALAEQLIDHNDLFQINWLELGLRVARSVARIGGQGRGTGVMVSPLLFLTNYHVLQNPRAAAQSRAYFNDEVDVNGFDKQPVEFELLPEHFFFADEELDFTLVALPADASTFGFCPLIADLGKIKEGEAVTIIQHPEGGKKHIAFRSNRVTEILKNFIRYETDTLGGSSGSPVFSDQWELVALHHLSQPVTDAEGNPLKRDHTPASASTLDSEILWEVNEGVRASRILERVSTGEPSGDQPELRDSLLGG